MKRETINALLVDRALGELTPEVIELLNQYLADHPELAARAVSMIETASLARAALPRAQSTSVLPLPEPPWRASNWLRSVTLRGEWLALAACLVLGAAIGWISHGLRPPTLAPAGAIASLPRAVGNASGPDLDQNATFWSAASLAEYREGHNAVPSRYRLRWESPTRMPHLEVKP